MKKVTAVLVGAGLRGAQVYANYALEHADAFQIVAVAEPRSDRREETGKLHQIEAGMQFERYEELLALPRIADCALICTQDRMHYEPVMMALERGYHVLCEKPMSPFKKEIEAMGKLADQHGRVLSICHVLRYSPFFVQIKTMLERGDIGELISILHMESVGYWHQAHSFVRGNWRNETETSPMILQKCCHDIDILMWLAKSPCVKVSSFGSLSYFKEEHAPKDAPAYCMDGCGERENCPFYAPRFYLEHPKASEDGFVKVVSADTSEEAVLEALRQGPYGRCVFHCDNDVVDHQVVNLEFENQMTASLTMCAFTNRCERTITLMGTKGQIKGNMELGELEYIDFLTGKEEIIRLHTSTKGHSGSDEHMMEDFVELVRADGEMGSRSAAALSVESHLAALAAEESRVTGRTILLSEFRNE